MRRRPIRRKLLSYPLVAVRLVAAIAGVLGARRPPRRPLTLAAPSPAAAPDPIPQSPRAKLPAAPTRRSADILELAQEAGGFGVFDLNLVTGNISGTPQFFDLIGLQSRSLTLTREEWVASIHPADLEAVGVELGAAIDSGTKYQSEYRTLLLNGAVRWLASRREVLNDAEGFGTVRHGIDFIAGFLEKARHEHARDRVILGEQIRR